MRLTLKKPQLPVWITGLFLATVRHGRGASPSWRSSNSGLPPISKRRVMNRIFFLPLQAARYKGGVPAGTRCTRPGTPSKSSREAGGGGWGPVPLPLLFSSTSSRPRHPPCTSRRGRGLHSAGRGTGDSSPALPCGDPPHCPQRGRGRPRRDGPRPTRGDAGSLRGRPCCPPTGLDPDGDHPQATKHRGRARALTVMCGMLFFP